MISRKQQMILAFPFTGFQALICDGAVRSGKTVFMTIGFIDDAMRRFDRQRFGICGFTIDSAVKNIILPYLALGYARERYRLQWKSGEHVLVVSDGVKENRFEVFGGRDDAAYMTIQGRTLAGVLFDEVALQARSFVEQALARCSVEGSRFWFNCNPESPEHWFYKEWICQLERHRAVRIHFRLEDNPGLSQEMIRRYESLYSGVFYRRYILGEWCLAQGLVYPGFGEGCLCGDEEIPVGGEYYISVDYGTLNPFSAGLWCVKDGRAIRVREFYHSGRKTMRQMTDEEYCDAIELLAGDCAVRKIVVDPSAASFIMALRRRGFTVMRADNRVMDGIRVVAEFLRDGRIRIHRGCVDAIREFGGYRWDEDAGEDRVIKEEDHAMDEIRYFCMTILRRAGRN